MSNLLQLTLMKNTTIKLSFVLLSYLFLNVALSHGQSAVPLPDYQLTQGNSTNIDSSYLDSVQSLIGEEKPNISISISPPYPEPNQDIVVTVRASSIDLDTSSIIWYVNDKLLVSGMGIKSIETKTGNNNEKTKIKVVINRNGSSFESSRIIAPSELFIFQESQTYVPPFYRGLPLPTYGSTNKIIAITNFLDNNGKKIDNNKIIYNWRLNGVNISSASGLGKNSFVHKTASTDLGFTISVSASDIDGKIQNQKIQKFSFVQNPSVLIYEDDPALGILLNRQIGKNIILSTNEMTAVIKPFFFAKEDLPIVTYEWLVNDVRTHDGNNNTRQN
jgi:hypothetical protein